jgi:serine/threonine protein kinase
VVAQTLDGEEQQFYIFNNVVLGEGGYGVVKKAVTKDTTKELAVKIIPFGGDENKRKKIEKEINILRILPESRHLVRVLPIKCYSENNFYIFMEICKDGTLSDFLKLPNHLQEEKVFDIFWQLLTGYRVLW